MRFLQRTEPASGFTLIEVLIAVGLASLLMLGLISALFAFGKSSTRVEGRLDRIEEVRLLSEFLRFSLGAVADSTHFDGREARIQGFRGSNDELRWIGTMPARHGGGGLHRLRLHVEERREGRALVLQYLAFSGPDRIPDWSDAPSHTLLQGLEAFAIAFKPSPEGSFPEHEWQETWEELPNELPELVSLSIAADGRVWPKLVIRLRPLPNSNEVMDAFADENA